MCYGTCPVYVVSLDHRGRFTWDGEYFVPVIGRHEGDLSRSLFTALARMIDDYGFFGWDDEYVEPVTDVPETILTVEREGVTKTVRQSGTNKPAKLQVLATFIDGMVAPALWEIEVSSSWGAET